LSLNSPVHARPHATMNSEAVSALVARIPSSGARRKRPGFHGLNFGFVRLSGGFLGDERGDGFGIHGCVWAGVNRRVERTIDSPCQNCVSPSSQMSAAIDARRPVAWPTAARLIGRWLER